VQKRILPLAITAISFFSLVGLNCTKLDTTDIGSDLLPAVDNVNTFDTILPIITTQGVFLPDSTYILRTDDHAVGINNDPVFGQTNASIYFQLKPLFYPFSIANPSDTLFPDVDSVVLCLKYTGSYGDTLAPLQVQVFSVFDNPPYLFRDSTNIYRNVAFQPGLGVNVGFSSTNTIDVTKLDDTVKYVNNNGFSVNTIRIRLSHLYASVLYHRDTFFLNPSNNAFRNDSLFRQFYNGLAVLPAGAGNQLVYIDLASDDTRLEIHHRKKRFGGGIDTVYTSLLLNRDFVGSAANRSSSTANYITRNRPALPSGDQEVYLQTSPGTYANLSIPALSTLSNRIVHRAELIVEEIPDLTGSADKFKAPNFLYIELKDTTGTAKWKPVYYDLNPSIAYDPDYKNPFSVISYFPANIDFAYFGGFLRNKTGSPARYYNFNITRYVQDLITNHKPNYQLRLSAPFNVKYPQYSSFPNPYGNNIAYGRVKVGGGNNPDPNYRMRLRIVYSKL
jgi:Domain of unknown function (DUF4270)